MVEQHRQKKSVQSFSLFDFFFGILAFLAE